MAKKLFATYDQIVEVEHKETLKNKKILSFTHVYEIKVNGKFFKRQRVYTFDKKMKISKMQLEENTEKEIMWVIRKYNRGFEDTNPKLLALLVEVDYD